METKIHEYLNDIEKKYDIKILLACETGSRAWGFPSPDSDFDIRLIYKHKKDWYLHLTEEKDTIELMLDDNIIDISGWDVRKTLRLLWKSNPPLLERIQSSIIYKSDELFLSEINEIANNFYSRIATIHHYSSMAKNFLAEISQNEEYKLKKLFYALRCALACKWILEREDIPPIYFPKMINELEFKKELKEKIFSLIDFKSTKDESYNHKGEKELFSLIDEILENTDIQAKLLPASKGDFNDLNTFFIKILNI